MKLQNLLLSLSIVVLALSAAWSDAATVTWSNAASANKYYWKTNANWYGGTGIAAGDTLQLGGTAHAITNDFAANTSFAALVFTNGNWPLYGNAIQLTNGNNAAIYWNPRNPPNNNDNNINFNVTFTRSASISNLNAGTALLIFNTANTITNPAGLTVSAVPSSVVRIDAAIYGAGGLTKVGTGQLFLRGANVYAGNTDIKNGVLKFGIPSGTAGNRLPVTTVLTLGDSAANTSAQVDMNNRSQTLAGLATAGTGTANRITNNNAGTVNLTISNTSPCTFNGYLGDGAAVANANTINLVKDGAGVFTLSAPSGGNAYSAGTTITAGTLKLGAAEQLPDGAGKSNVTVNGLLDLNGFNETINGLTGAGAIDNVAGGGAVTLTVGGNNQSSVFTGALKNTSGTLTVNKTGTGTVTLAGTNTYTGATTVSDGKLVLSTVHQADSAITVNDGKLFGALVIFTGTTLTTPSLTLGHSAGPTTNTFDLGALGNPTAPVAWATNLTVNGTAYIDVAGVGLTTNTPVELIQFQNLAGSGSADFVLRSLPGGVGAYLWTNTTLSTLELVITNVPSLTWAGFANVTTNQLVTLAAAAAPTNLALPVPASLASSIVVTDPNNSSTVFVKDTDYTVSTVGTTTSIQGLTGGAFVDSSYFPTNVLVTYAGLAAANQWQANTPVNWVDASSGQMLSYADGLAVIFDDSATNGTTAVLLQQTVAPFNVMVTNNSLTYGIGGAFGITDPSGKAITFTKTGSGTLFLTNTGANTYSGDTVIASGTLILGSGGLPNGAGKGNVLLNNATLGLAGSSPTINGLNGNGTIDNVAAGATNMLTVGANNASGSFSGLIQNTVGTLILDKQGSGALTLSGLNTYSGGTTNSSTGTLGVGHDSALGSGSVWLRAGTTFSSADATPRTLPNDFILGGNCTLGHAVNNGKLAINGSVQFNGAGRDLTFNSDVVWNGPSTNGFIANKLGPATLVLKGVNQWNGGGTASELRLGTLLVDGGVITNNNTVRPDCNVAGGLARMVLTNGARFVNTLSTSNQRAGNGGNSTATNILDLAGTLRFPNADTSNGRLLLGSGCALAVANLWPGGDLQVNYVDDDGSTATNISELNFHGGILRPIRDSADFIRRLDFAYVRDGGAIIDSGTFNVGIAQNLLAGGTGGLTKLGAGTLTLSGTNTYTGLTTVAAGKLALTTAHAGGGAITVNDDTALAVGIPTPGTTLAVSDLTLGSGAGVVTNEFNLGFGNPIAPVIHATNCATAGGTVYLKVTGSGLTPAASFTLIQFDSAITGNGTNGMVLLLPPGVQGNLVSNANTLEVSVLSVPVLVWSGVTNDGTQNVLSEFWNLTATNWIDPTLPGSVAYTDGAAVQFDDTAATNRVSLTQTFQPGPAQVTNDILDYVFTGSGKISGGTGLTKQGAARLTINTTNDFTGLVTITGGTLVAGNSNALGSAAGGTVITNGGTLDVFSQLLNREPITVSGAGVGGLGAIVNSGAAQQQNAARFVTLAGDTTFGGAQRWDVRGTTASSAVFSTGGQAYNLTKVGSNYVALVIAQVDAALGDIEVKEGSFGYEFTTTSLGDPAKTLTLYTNTYAQMWQNVNPLNKKVVVKDGGQLRGGSGTSNVVTGPVTAESGLGQLYAASGATLTLSNTVDGAGGWRKIQPGVVTLAANNTFGGPVWVEAGTLAVNADANLGAGSQVIISNATLRATDGFTLSASRSLQIGSDIGAGAGTVEVLTNVLSYAGTVANFGGGSGMLIKTGAGTLTLSGNNTYSGGASNVAGTLQIGHDNALGSGPLSVGGGTVATAGGVRTIANPVAIVAGTPSIDTTAGDLILQGPLTDSTSIDPTKIGDNSLILRGGQILAGPTNAGAGWNILRGYLVVDGCLATNTDDGIRLKAENDAAAGLAVTNSASYYMGTASGSPNLRLGNTASLTGTNIFHISSGQFVMEKTAQEILVGDAAGATGVVYQTGGTVRWTNNTSATVGVALGSSTNASGTYNFDGGTLVTPRVRGGAGTGFFFFNGGTLSPSTNLYAATFMQGLTAASIKDNNAVIDTAGLDLTIGQPLLADGVGGLEKRGLGALTLTSNNTYVGSTIVSNGTLALSGAGAVPNSASIRVSGGATFDVSAVTGGFTLGATTAQTLQGNGTVTGAVTVALGSTVSPGASIGTLTCQSPLTNHGTLHLEITNGSACDQLAGSGQALAYGGTLDVINTGAPFIGGEVFSLFPGWTYSGAFAATNLPLPLAAGLNWWTGNLAVNGTLVVNRAPLAASTNASTSMNQPVTLVGAAILAVCTDPDSNPLSLASVTPSTNGASVILSGGDITYTPNHGFLGEDRFDYTISDGRGGSATATVIVTVNPLGEGYNRVAAESLGAGSVRLTYLGIPNYRYSLEWATNLNPTITWLPLLTNTTATNGFLIFTNTSSEPANFYRTRSVP